MESVRSLKILPRLGAVMVMAVAFVVLPGVSTPAYADDDATCTPGPNGEPIVQDPWHVERMNLDLAHPHSKGMRDDGERVTVAVIDSGVEADHPTFGGRVVPGLDIGDEDKRGMCDGDGHGTAVAGIIAGGSDDSSYMGVAPEAEIWPARVIESVDTQVPEGEREKLSGWLAEGIEEAVDAGVDVINVSAGGVDSNELRDAVTRAHNAGIVIVAAIGNDNEYLDQAEEPPAYPAMYDNVIAVGSISSAGTWDPMSNFGEAVELVAPGEQIAGPAPGGEGYNFEIQGTSFAAPHVAGTVALLLAKYPDADVEWIRNRLFATADPPGSTDNNFYGHGIVSPYRALTDLSEDVVTPEEDEEENHPIVPVEDEAQDQWPAVVDPLHNVRMAAMYTLIGAVTTIVVVVVLKKLIPVGRNRGWAPGTRKSLDD